MEPATRIEWATCGLRNSEIPISDKPHKKPQTRWLLRWILMGLSCLVLVAVWLQKNLAVKLELIDMGLGVAQWIWRDLD